MYNSNNHFQICPIIHELNIEKQHLALRAVYNINIFSNANSISFVNEHRSCADNIDRDK